MLRVRSALALAALVTLAGTAPAAAAPGDVDTTYGAGGSVAVTGTPNQFVLDPENTAVITSGSLVHRRLLADGSPAPGFESGPRHVTFADGGSGSARVAAALLPDGRAILAGDATRNENSGYTELVFERALADGTPDPSFGNDGVVTLDLTGEDGLTRLHSAGVDDHGRIVFAAEFSEFRGYSGDIVGRLLPDGTLDASYGDGGVVWVAQLDPRLDDPEAGGLVVQRDGSAVVAAFGYRDEAVFLKLTDTGSLDAAWGDHGALVIPPQEPGGIEYEPNDLVPAPGGELVAGGEAMGPDHDTFWAIRLTPDGHVDTSFGGPFGVRLPLIGDFGTDGATSVAAQANGKVVLGGVTLWNDPHQVQEHGAVVRLDPDATVDHAFADDGVRLLDDVSSVRDVALQQDGKILTGGDGAVMTRLDGDGDAGAPATLPPAATPPAATPPASAPPATAPPAVTTAPASSPASPAPARRPAMLRVSRSGRVRVQVRPARHHTRTWRGVVRLRAGGKSIAVRRFAVRTRRAVSVVLRLRRPALRRLRRHAVPARLTVHRDGAQPRTTRVTLRAVKKA